MIRAVVEAARGGGEVPPPLRLAWFCGGEHLPESGGVMDQDYQTLRQMNICRNIYRVVQDAPRYKGNAIHDAPEDVLRVIKMLMGMGLWRPAVTDG